MPTLSLRHGTRLSASGSSPPVSPLVALSDTPATFSQSLSPPTTDKSSLARATEPSSYGTPSETANTLLPTRDTLSGFRACDSAPTPRTPLLSALAGTKSSRYVENTLKLPPLTCVLHMMPSMIISICYFRASAMRLKFTIFLI